MLCVDVTSTAAMWYDPWYRTGADGSPSNMMLPSSSESQMGDAEVQMQPLQMQPMLAMSPMHSMHPMHPMYVLPTQQMAVLYPIQPLLPAVQMNCTQEHGIQKMQNRQMQKAATRNGYVNNKPQDLVGDESEHQRRQMLLSSLNSLYEDQIMPNGVLLQRRIEEKYGEHWSSKQLISLCSIMPEIKLVGGSKLHSSGTMVLLQDPPKDFEGFVDPSLLDDEYPPELWLQVKAFLEEQVIIRNFQAQKDCPKWPGSRYLFAKWMRNRLKCLAEYTLGHVCHIVHLCVSKRELLGYHHGNLVPYQLSDNCRKKSHALLSMPAQIRPGETYVQTWDQAGEVIALVVEQGGGAVKLSCLKSMCRNICHVELSECALGHTKLMEFLQDYRLKSPSGGTFAIESVGTQYHVVHKEPSHSPAPSPTSSGNLHQMNRKLKEARGPQVPKGAALQKNPHHPSLKHDVSPEECKATLMLPYEQESVTTHDKEDQGGDADQESPDQGGDTDQEAPNSPASSHATSPKSPTSPAKSCASPDSNEYSKCESSELPASNEKSQKPSLLGLD
jgi:hypothetical protein